ncbi:MAG: hypothetical protein J0L83_04385 [Chitinophagales bacterium]|nr:hypothetical protein [Chitinophagales bacterium]
MKKTIFAIYVSAIIALVPATFIGYLSNTNAADESIVKDDTPSKKADNKTEVFTILKTF